MDVNTDKDGAVTAVDGGLFHIGKDRYTLPKKCHGVLAADKRLMSYHGNFLVQEELRDNSLGKGKATKLYWIS